MKTIKTSYYLIPVVLSVLVVMGLLYYFFLTDFVEEKEGIAYIYIDEDDSIDSVFVKLEPYASEHTMAGFKCIARHSGYKDKVRTGRYAIKPGISVINTFRNLKNGHQEAEMLTIPEARTADKLAGVLARKLMLDSLTIAASLTDNDFCQRWGYDTATIACLFVPNTYEVYWNVSLDKLMERMQKEHLHFWNGERTAKATALGLTPNEICTMASIIDEETANNAEKPMIAGMYLNRLNEGMPLQADPTIKFAMNPIKIASIKGIDAVLNRVVHDYLYMCAKEDFSGTHNFARTYSEHLKNAAKYSKALNERGIK